MRRRTQACDGKRGAGDEWREHARTHARTHARIHADRQTGTRIRTNCLFYLQCHNTGVVRIDTATGAASRLRVKSAEPRPALTMAGRVETPHAMFVLLSTGHQLYTAQTFDNIILLVLCLVVAMPYLVGWLALLICYQIINTMGQFTVIRGGNVASMHSAFWSLAVSRVVMSPAIL